MKSLFAPFIFAFVLFVSNVFMSNSANASSQMILTDTLVFDLSESVFTTQNEQTFIEFPVRLHTDDLFINAVDFWFQFNLDKLTYVSTTSEVSSLDVFTNYNSNNQYLSNTSSTTSWSVYLPLEVPIMKLKFVLNNPCVEVLESDFYSQTTLLNGIVSSELFVPLSQSPEASIQIESPEPYCQNLQIYFSYGPEINGNPVTSYEWDFGNGLQGSGPNPNNIYSESGTYTVTLNATTSNGCTHIITTSLEILPSPEVSFTTVYDGATNTFSYLNNTTISSGTVDSYWWDFGDGQWAEVEEPQHIYASQGLYNVTLSATSDLGCSSSVTQVVDAPVGVVESEIRAFEVFPNPAVEQFQVYSNVACDMVVVDELGKIVAGPMALMPGLNQPLSCASLAAGVYHLQGLNGSEGLHKRLLVIR